MRLPLRLLPEARAEFDEAADRYERHQPGLGVDLVARVGDVLRRVAGRPELHPAAYQDVRKAVVAGSVSTLHFGTEADPSDHLDSRGFATSRPGVAHKKLWVETEPECPL